MQDVVIQNRMCCVPADEKVRTTFCGVLETSTEKHHFFFPSFHILFVEKSKNGDIQAIRRSPEKLMVLRYPTLSENSP